MDAQERLIRPQRAGRAEEGEGPRDARVGRPETVRVWLLGRFRVSVGTQTVEEGAWRLRKASALVKLLALAPGHHLHRERAMDLLWPEHGKRASANNLSQALHAARRAFGSDDTQVASSYLASQGEQLMLCPGGELWLDIEAFEEAAATARRSREPAAYRVALNLYAGELLPRDPYEEWAEVPREGLRQLFLALLVELASLHEERGEYGPGIEALRRILVEEPTREEAHMGLMRLYALGGRQAEALAQYARLEESLSREFRADCLLARLRVDHDLPYRHPAIVAGVGALEAGVMRLYGVVVILGGWVRVGCARLCGVHSEPPSSVGRSPGAREHSPGSMVSC
jgi:DNA-binding SARP family transcriptional activator